jgi:hypothetical protein
VTVAAEQASDQVKERGRERRQPKGVGELGLQARLGSHGDDYREGRTVGSHPIDHVEHVAPFRCVPYKGRGRHEKLGCWRAEKD